MTPLPFTTTTTRVTGLSRCPNPARRATSLASTLTVVLAVLATACVGSGKTPRTEEIQPLPTGMDVVTDVVAGCREGESGFDYRFLVIGPAEATRTGNVARHLADRGFARTGPIPNDGWSTRDLPWTEVTFQNRSYPLRVEVGRLDRYLDDPVPYTGPSVESIPQDVRDDAERYVLVALRPSDFQCHTPL